MTTQLTPEQIQDALKEPFPADAISWKPQATKGNRALAIAYIDARDVEDRLDSVLGIANWQDAYTPLSNGNIMCTLSLRINGEWVSKSDIGGPSDQRDLGDKEKAAFSDALKRAAVKWGIGRYLYRLDGGWVEYDEQRKQLKGTPALPAWALPNPKGKPAPAQTARAEQPPAAKPANGSGPPSSEPRTHLELEVKIAALGAALAKNGLAEAADPDRELQRFAKDQKFPADTAAWSEEQVRAGYAAVRSWKQRISAGSKQPAAK